MKLLLVFTAVSAVLCSAAIESNFYREETCSKVNGFCLLENECPHAVEMEFKDLCGAQKKDGAVCCKDFPQDNVNCYQQHNDCTTRCPKALNSGRRGCPSDMFCCVLV